MRPTSDWQRSLEWEWTQKPGQSIMKTILLVDDDPLSRELTEMVLQEECYRVVSAEDGMQAIEHVTKEMPDVAILDIQMPKMSGLEVAEELHALAPQLPLILYTANDDLCERDDRTRYVAACVDKNSGFTDLLFAVGRVLMPSAQSDRFRIGLAPKPAVAYRVAVGA
jgi:CheY-like chemotaxis protein